MPRRAKTIDDTIVTDNKPKTTKESTPRKKKKKNNYLNNADLLVQVVKSKIEGQMSPELAKMLTLLTSNFSKKSKFASYTYNEDMQAYAMMMLVRTWHKFNVERKNPFAFYTQCVKNSFIQYLNQEKRQRLIRDEILVKKGLTPSFNYQLEYEAGKVVEDEEDHNQQATAVNVSQQARIPEEEFFSC